MSNISDLFCKDKCRVGGGVVVIDLRSCDVTFCPTMLLENAAKLAAKSIYQAMEHDRQITPEPEWLNSVTFSAEDTLSRPAIRVVNDKFFYNAPPFKKTKRNLSFWTAFTSYWNVMTVHAMEKALFARQFKTAKEKMIIDRYHGVEL